VLPARGRGVGLRLDGIDRALAAVSRDDGAGFPGIFWRTARAAGSVPRVQMILVNRQRRVRFDVEWLRRFAGLALAECMHHSGDGRFRLKAVPVVEVAVVSDVVIARVHRQFMGVPGATDVITFEHGEIVVSADTAKLAAAEHGHGLLDELGLYIIHGLLHLNGYDDLEPRARARMHRVQDRIWKRLLAQVSLPSRAGRGR
jgi:probable rRNA maturation factor